MSGLMMELVVVRKEEGEGRLGLSPVYMHNSRGVERGLFFPVVPPVTDPETF